MTNFLQQTIPAESNFSYHNLQIDGNLTSFVIIFLVSVQKMNIAGFHLYDIYDGGNLLVEVQMAMYNVIKVGYWGTAGGRVL